jgi:hypothetical protein
MIGLRNIRLTVVELVGKFLISYRNLNLKFSSVVTKLSLLRISHILREFGVDECEDYTSQLTMLSSMAREHMLV